MQPRKTDLAHAVLQAHRAPLDLRQRRALILCDGQRTLTDLVGLLGGDAAGLIAQLQQAGYLHSQAPPAAPPSKPPTERRRSLVAARLYLLDILALQRNPAAAHLHALLQTTRDERDTVDTLRLVLLHLQGVTSAGYAARVSERLCEVLPETHLPAMLESTALSA